MSHTFPSASKVPLTPARVPMEALFLRLRDYSTTMHLAEKISRLPKSETTEQKNPEALAEQKDDLHTVLLVAGPYRAVISSWGARLLSFMGPDGIDIVTGPRQKDALLADDSAMGAVVGRVANRIGQGKLHIPGQGSYQLPLNDGPHHLHGGPQGFHQRLWQVDDVEQGTVHNMAFATVDLSLTSSPGDQGYPGHVHVQAKYTLTSDGSLRVDLTSHVTEAISPVNLTHHAYWNLSGHGPSPEHKSHNCLHHWLVTPFGSYLETDLRHLPTGRILGVTDSPFDFTREKTLGRDLPKPSDVSPVGGYDVFLTQWEPRDNSPLSTSAQKTVAVAGEPLPLIARLQDEAKQRSLEVRSNQPGFQLYTGNYLCGTYGQYQAVCIEPSGLVDAVNHPHFPSILVSPGQTVHQTTVFQLRDGDNESLKKC